MGINFFRLLMIYLKPVLPETAAHVERFLDIDPLQWHDKNTALLKHRIQAFQPLITRIDPAQIEAMKMAAQQDIQQSSQPATAQATTAAPATADTATPAQAQEKTYISIDDFNKIDLRIAKVVEADSVEGADKLLRLKVDVGGETRQIFAGIKSTFQPEQLIGKQVVIVANLAPRKMRFGLSEGMVIVASGTEDNRLYLVSPEEGAKPGMKVK